MPGHASYLTIAMLLMAAPGCVMTAQTAPGFSSTAYRAQIDQTRSQMAAAGTAPASPSAPRISTRIDAR